MKKKILIVAAHPDDEILGCGGFISKYKNKFNYSVLFLAEGNSCRYKDVKKNYIKIKEEIIDRKKQCLKALKSLSVKNVVFNDNPCGSLNSLPIIKLNQIIEKEIQKHKPEIVFTHSKNDLNYDHKIVFQSVMMATRPVGKKNYVKEIYSFEILSSSEWSYAENFKPNFFVSLSKKNLNDKWKALKFYKNEIRKAPHPRSFFGVKSLANFRGLQAGTEYAEAYKIIRLIN